MQREHIHNGNIDTISLEIHQESSVFRLHPKLEVNSKGIQSLLGKPEKIAIQECYICCT